MCAGAMRLFRRTRARRAARARARGCVVRLSPCDGAGEGSSPPGPVSRRENGGPHPLSPSPQFVAGFEDRQGELFYELSDLLALDLFIDEYGSTVQQLNRAKALMERTTKFAIQLAGAAEAVLNEYVQSNGFRVSQSADSGGAA